MKKRIVSLLLCGMMALNLCGTSTEAAKGNSHSKKVEKHLKYKDLGGIKKMKIDTAVKNCPTNGEEAAKQINGLKSDAETFEIGVKEVLDTYYGEEQLPAKEQEELESFVREIDDSAKEIVGNYEEAALERENAENLPYETEKVLVSFPYGTDWETIETIVENEAVGYEVIDDGKYHIDETLPEEKKQQLAVLKDIKKDIVILAEVKLGDTVTRAEERFEKYDCVISAHSNLYLEQDDMIQDNSGTKVNLTDPHFKPYNAWHLIASNVPQAWARMSQASKLYDVVVAVIDNGVDMDHPDLDGVLLKEKCVDVTVENQNLPNNTSVKKLIMARSVADKDGQYTGSHGTAVTGVLAAEAGNGMYGAGAASMGGGKFQNHIRIMAIKADNAVGSRHITIGYLAKAINYAVSNGADVINLSYSAVVENVNATQKKQITEAIQNAIHANIPVVCSAGNDGEDAEQKNGTKERFPTNVSGVIGVGAVGFDGKLPAYTNRSKAVDILAPSSGGGRSIYTTEPIEGTNSNGYKYSGQTSCATPQVTAAVAMMRCLNYSLSPSDISYRLKKRSSQSITDTRTGNTFKILDTGNSVALTNATKK